MASMKFENGDPIEGICYKKDKTTRKLSESELEIFNDKSKSLNLDCDE